MEFIFNFLAFFLALIVVIYLLLCIIPVQMAAKRGRNIMLWFVLAIFTSPFLAILMIACIGETDEKRKERIIQEEEWRNMYCRKSNQVDKNVKQNNENIKDSKYHLKHIFPILKIKQWLSMICIENNMMLYQRGIRFILSLQYI